MKVIFGLILVLGSQMSWAADPVSQCGNTDQLEQRSDAVTRAIFSQNYPKFGQDQILGDGVAAPRNWYDEKSEVLHFYRGVIVRGLPPENEAVFELTFSLKSGGCTLEAVQMIEPFSEKLVSANLLSAPKELIKSFNKSKFVKSVMSGIREEYAQTCPQLKLQISTDSNFVAESTCSSDYEEAVFVSFKGHFLKTVPYVEKVELRHFN